MLRQLGEAHGYRGRTDTQQIRTPADQGFDVLVHARPETPPHAIAFDGRTHTLSDRVRDAWRRDRVGTHECHRHRTTAAADTRCERPEGGPVPDTPDQADSRSRPLRRRAARTARPARVLMRTRNPCVFLRLRVFGWNVRFTVLSPRRSAEHAPHPGQCQRRECRPCDSLEAGRSLGTRFGRIGSDVPTADECRVRRTDASTSGEVYRLPRRGSHSALGVRLGSWAAPCRSTSVAVSQRRTVPGLVRVERARVA